MLYTHEKLLVNVLRASDIEPVQAASIELMREVPFNPLSALPLLASWRGWMKISGSSHSDRCDSALGMSQRIHRRDFMNSVLLASGGALLG